MHIATPTDGQSDDEEFVDCNSTFRSSTSSINNTLDDVTIDSNVTIASDEAQTTLENEEPSSNDNASSVSNRKLNLGFIEAGNSVAANVVTEKSMEGSETDSKDTTISSSFIDDSGSGHQLIGQQLIKSLEAVDSESDLNTVPASETDALIQSDKSDHVIELTGEIQTKNLGLDPTTEEEATIESKCEFQLTDEELNVALDVLSLEYPAVGQQDSSIISNNKLNQTVVVEENSPITDTDIENQESNTKVESAPVTDVFVPVIESNAELDVSQDDKVLNLTVDINSAIDHTKLESECPHTDKTLNLSLDVSNSDTSAIVQQDSTYISKSNEVVQSVLLEVESLKSDQKIEAQENTSTIGIEANVVEERTDASNPVVQSNFKLEFANSDEALNLSLGVPSSDNSAVYQQDSTFISQNNEVNQTVVVEAESPKSAANIENQESNTDAKVNPGTDVFPQDNIALNVTLNVSNLDNSPVDQSRLESEFSQDDEVLNLSIGVPKLDNSAVGQQDSTSISNNYEVNQTVVVEANSPKSDQKIESLESNIIAAEANVVVDHGIEERTDAFDPLIESKLQLEQDDKALNVTRDVINLGDSTVDQSKLESEFPQEDKVFNVTCDVPNWDSLPVVQQNSTNNQTIVVEVEALKTDPKQDCQEESNAKLNQDKKINAFKAQPAYSADSLELDSEPQDCSLDSLEMKPDEPTDHLIRKDVFDLSTPSAGDSETINLNDSISKLSRQETFKIPPPLSALVSRHETFNVLSPQSESDSSASVNDITVLLNRVSIASPIGDRIDSSDRLKRSGTFEILSVDGVNQKLTSSSDGQPNAESNESELKTPVVASVPIPNSEISNDDALPNSEFFFKFFNLKFSFS